jgi:hypothetical protein
MAIRDSIGNQFFRDQFCLVNIGGQSMLARVVNIQDSGMLDIGGGKGMRQPGMLTIQVVIPLQADQNGVVAAAWVLRQPKDDEIIKGIARA